LHETNGKNENLNSIKTHKLLPYNILPLQLRS